MSIHPLSEAGDPQHETALPVLAISIHALREEGDGAPQALPL